MSYCGDTLGGTSVAMPYVQFKIVRCEFLHENFPHRETSHDVILIRYKCFVIVL